MPLRILLFSLTLASMSCESSTEVVAIDTYRSDLSGANVRPAAVTTTGTGALTITLKSNTTRLDYELSFNGLTSTATAAHIHGPANDTSMATVILDFVALATSGQGTVQLGMNGSAKGTIDLKSAVTPTVSGDSLFRLLSAKLLYVDVHTTADSAGEIRGQIAKR